MRAAEAHGHAEPLRGADADVRAPLAGGREARQREQVRSRHDFGAGGVRRLHHRRVINHRAVGGGVLQQHAAHVVPGVVKVVLVAHDNLQPESVRARAAHLDGLRVALLGDQELGLLPAVDRRAHRHRFRRGGALVQERRLRHRHAGEVRNHRLVVQERLQAALRDLRLVRRVLRVPAGVLQHVAQDDGGDVRAVVPRALVGLEHLVLARHRLEHGQVLALRERLRPLTHLHAVVAADVRGHGRVHERVHGLEPDVLGHRRLIRLGRAVVPALEGIQRAERLGGDASHRARRKPRGQHGRRARDDRRVRAVRHSS